MFESVRRDDGSVINFDKTFLQGLIIRLQEFLGERDDSLTNKLTKQVLNHLRGLPGTPHERDVVDVIEFVLRFNNELGLLDALKVHCETYGLFGSNLTKTAINLLRDRYLQPGEESVELFKRVSRVVAKAEESYGGDSLALSEQFFKLLKDLDFLPNSPTLMNAGVNLEQLSACFVLPINDSLKSIFNTLRDSMMIHHSGGGVGINFSNIRPRGSLIKSTGGRASGPVSFIQLFNKASGVVKQGGRRRGANMAVIDYDHPDILEFIDAKLISDLPNFNLSVSVSDSFMRQVLSDSEYSLKNGKKLKARLVFNKIVNNAWTIGEPGLLFIDEINRQHPLKERIESTNPCGEQPLLPYESCNLGSINLSHMVVEGEIDWAKLERVTRLAVRFLDNVIDVTDFPLKEIKKVTLSNRKIGLGVMGFADLLIKLGVPYESEESLKLADQLMKFIQKKARDESRLLGQERGSFPNFKTSKLKRKYKSMRNATITTIAPTGSISIIAGCSSSIEPLFNVAYKRKLLGSDDLFVNELFQAHLIKEGLYSGELINEVMTKGLIKAELSAKTKALFKSGLHISPEFHVKMQAVFQRHVDNAISKTVNLPVNASLDDVASVFLLAYKLKCKGITVYRDQSKSQQVLSCPGGECE